MRSAGLASKAPAFGMTKAEVNVDDSKAAALRRPRMVVATDLFDFRREVFGDTDHIGGLVTSGDESVRKWLPVERAERRLENRRQFPKATRALRQQSSP